MYMIILPKDFFQNSLIWFWCTKCINVVYLFGRISSNLTASVKQCAVVCVPVRGTGIDFSVVLSTRCVVYDDLAHILLLCLCC